MARSKIDNTSGGRTEVKRWYEEGRTYAWMAEEYLRKYNLEISPSAFSNLRASQGWERRITRDDELIPWDVKPEHRWHRYVALLRVEARRRAGRELRPRDAVAVENFLAELAEVDGVIYYDPETPEGFHVVRREPGDDDIIRRPKKGVTRRKSTD